MDVSQYNQDYYSKNKDRISARRKERWRTDPEYREKINERRKRYLSTAPKGKVGRKGSNLPRIFLLDGRRIFLYSIGSITRVLDRHYSTIRNWVSAGVLPAVEDDQGNLWFSQSTLAGCRKVMDLLPTAKYERKYEVTVVLRLMLERYFVKKSGKKAGS